MFQRRNQAAARSRRRYAAIGAVVAVLLGGGGLLTASASTSPGSSSFVPITPCRLFDTRPATAVGSRTTPLGQQGTFTATVWGSNGNCTIPTGATGVSMNVVAVNPTAPSFLTVFPADQPQPLASSLNWIANQPPTPNAVTVSLSADGKISFFNNAGTVDLAADIVGYYLTAPDPGPRPARVLWVAASGGDYTTVTAALNAIGTAVPASDASHPYLIRIGPGTYNEPGGISLKSNVDLEGSGADVTTITCACGGPGSPFTDGSTATMRITGPSMTTEVRDLTVSNTGPGTYSTGIWNGGATPFGTVKLRDVDITATGGTGNYALVNDGSGISADRVSTNATGIVGSTEVYSIANVAGGGMYLQDALAHTAGPGASHLGVYNQGNLEVHTSIIIGSTASIDNGTLGTAYVADTELSPAVTGTPAAFSCVGDYDGLFQAVGIRCT